MFNTQVAPRITFKVQLSKVSSGSLHICCCCELSHAGGKRPASSGCRACTAQQLTGAAAAQATLLAAASPVPVIQRLDRHQMTVGVAIFTIYSSRQQVQSSGSHDVGFGEQRSSAAGAITATVKLVAAEHDTGPCTCRGHTGPSSPASDHTLLHLVIPCTSHKVCTLLCAC